MQTPINIFNHHILGLAVSGRELYKLTTETYGERDTFADRFRHNQKKLSLVDGKDFVETSTPVPERHPSRQFIEFIITLEAAKKIASIQTKGRGKGVIAFIEAYQHTITQAVAQEPAETSPLFVQNLTRLESAFKPAKTPESAINHESSSVVAKTEEQPQPLSPIQQLLKQAQELAEAEEKRKNEPVQPTGDMTQLAERIESVEGRLGRMDQMENKLTALLSLFNQASQSLQDLTPIDAEPIAEEPATPTTRSLLIRLVNSFAAAERRTEHETWKYLYGQFDLRHGFNVYAHAPLKGERNYLSIIEKQGHLDNLYTLAKKLFVLPELK